VKLGRVGLESSGFFSATIAVLQFYDDFVNLPRDSDAYGLKKEQIGGVVKGHMVIPCTDSTKQHCDSLLALPRVFWKSRN
jgi:hypothetical protein